jgi:hypothetical protein
MVRRSAGSHTDQTGRCATTPAAIRRNRTPIPGACHSVSVGRSGRALHSTQEIAHRLGEWLSCVHRAAGLGADGPR